MKITATFLLLLVLFSPHTPAQDSTHLNLPEGAVARFGKGGLAGIQYSPDSTRLAVASTIGIWLYDTTTHREVALLTGHTDTVFNVAFSPDGKTLASEGRGEIVWLKDPKTGERTGRLVGHTDNVHSIAFSPDGQMLASGSRDTTVLLWDMATGEPKRTLTGHTETVDNVVFSPDGKLLATGSWDKTVLLWKVAD